MTGAKMTHPNHPAQGCLSRAFWDRKSYPARFGIARDGHTPKPVFAVVKPISSLSRVVGIARDRQVVGIPETVPIPAIPRPLGRDSGMAGMPAQKSGMGRAARCLLGASGDSKHGDTPAGIRTQNVDISTRPRACARTRVRETRPFTELEGRK